MHKSALIIGAGRGVGREVALSLAGAGHTVTAVARTAADVETLATENANITARPADPSDAETANSLIADTSPDIVAIVGGLRPRMAFLSEYDWDSFSAVWQNDTRMTFNLLKAALTRPLKPGSTVLTVSSGAALFGSPLSGGYAGAKRMQHYASNYAQMESDKRDLGLTFTTLYPKQLIAGTNIAADASAAYGQTRGGTAADFMSQWDQPLTPEKVAAAITTLATTQQSGTYTVDGKGTAPLG